MQAAEGYVAGQIDQDVDPVGACLLAQGGVVQSRDGAPSTRQRFDAQRHGVFAASALPRLK
jgi:hypothetical protein